MFYIWTTAHVAAFVLVLYLAKQSTALWQIGTLAVPAAFLSTQISLLVHDILHGQAPRRYRFLRKPMSFLLGNIFVGLSDDWWKPKHNAHHRNPNHIDKDPDITSFFFAVDPKQLVGRGSVERFFARHQHWLIFGLIPLQALSFRKASFIFLLTKKKGLTRSIGLTGLLIHLVWYGAFLFLLGVQGGILFAVVHQALFGFHNSLIFAPNHKGMPTRGPDDKSDSFSNQVDTSRNVEGGLLFWYISGGLDLQIEHHLFPWMSRFNLRMAQPIVEEYCAEVNTPYTSASIRASYGQWIGHFRFVGSKA
jgi:fatty acid desaturase